MFQSLLFEKILYIVYLKPEYEKEEIKKRYGFQIILHIS